MSTDVDVQLRSYLETIDASAPPITVDELAHVSSQLAGPAHESGDQGLPVFDLREPVESAARAPQKRWSAVVLAVAAVIMLVVGIVVADGGDNVVTGAVASPGVVEPAASLAVADPGSSLWSLAFHDEAALEGDGESGMSGLVAGGPGFVAVGGRDGNAAVWTSVDGLTWSRVPHNEAVFGGDGESRMAAVAVGGPGLVAVGSQHGCTEQEVLDKGGSPRVDEVGNLEPDTVCIDGNAVVWTSVDGLTWSRVPHDEAVFGGRRRVYGMNSVTPGGPGLVAVGRSDEFGEGDALNEGDVNEGDAVVWTSVDGLTWSRVPHDEAVFGGVETQDMLDVTAGGPGLVAVGRDGGGLAWDNPLRGGQDSAVWTSIDGRTWARVPHDEAVFGGNGAGSSAMLSVTAGGPGLVAVGKHAWVWTSVDGLTWSRVVHDRGVGMTGFMVDVTVGGPGLIAVGSGGTEAAVWTSPDGLTWSLAANGEPEPGTFHAWMWGVTATNDRLIAVGSITAERDAGWAAAAWTSLNP